MKIGVVGTGQVGAACAFACVMRGVGTQLILVDHNPALAKAQAEDILHATPFSESVPVTNGEIADLKGCGIVMIAAGVPQKDPSETRLELLARNAQVFADIIPQILAAAPDAILLVASNPVDVMTDMAMAIAERAGLSDPSRIIGSGTILDTARFRALIAAKMDVSSHSVHAYVLGEHGDSEVLLWSDVNIGALPLEAFSHQTGRVLSVEDIAAIDDGVRRAAYHIIEGKGATWFGIGAGMARIAEAIVRDERALLTVSGRTENLTGGRVTLSVPRVIGAAGIVNTVLPPLSTQEAAELARSANVVRSACEELVAFADV
ncbi:MAG: L-lactate dehydrogenase [Pseudomonadota bacterium]